MHCLLRPLQRWSQQSSILSTSSSSFIQGQHENNSTMRWLMPLFLSTLSEKFQDTQEGSWKGVVFADTTLLLFMQALNYLCFQTPGYRVGFTWLKIVVECYKQTIVGSTVEFPLMHAYKDSCPVKWHLICGVLQESVLATFLFIWSAAQLKYSIKMLQ